MNKKSVFTAMIGVVIVLAMVACGEPEPDEWDTTGYEDLGDSFKRVIEDGSRYFIYKAQVSPGQFFIRGYFDDPRGTRFCYIVIPTANCKINLDRETFNFGHSSQSFKNDEVEFPVSVKAGEELKFYVDPLGRQSLSSAVQWLICFSVVPE
jgi:hypothetical protein